MDYNKRSGKWRARIKINGESKFLGHFESEIKAFNSYKLALEEIGESIIVGVD